MTGRTTRILIGTLLLSCGAVLAVEPAPPVTRAQYDQWMEEISNWGRWGAGDQLGTLNLITPEKRRAAALVRDGVTVSLALDLNTTADALNVNPFHHERQLGEFGGHRVAGDEYTVEYHGFAHSHLDGLPHFAHYGKMYNGFPIDALAERSTETLGIHDFAQGIFTRGILVDLPSHASPSSTRRRTRPTTRA
jgi:hypothetical protein